jgi:hypothetical protein
MVPAIAHAAQPEDVLQSLWEKTAHAGSTRHRFHREVLSDLNTLLDNVAAAAPDTLADVNDIPTQWAARRPGRRPRRSRLQQSSTRWLRLWDQSEDWRNAHPSGVRAALRCVFSYSYSIRMTCTIAATAPITPAMPKITPSTSLDKRRLGSG